MKNTHSSFIIFLILISLYSHAQTVLSGTVIDKNTKQPLPFVNIVYQTSRQLGTTTDLDGRFTIHSNSDVSKIEFSSMGYHNKILKTNEFDNLKNIKIYLSPKAYTLKEAEVFAKENPAHRIIEQAIFSRKDNKPSSLESYQYDTYNKMLFTFDMMFYHNEDTIGLDDFIFKDTLSKSDSNILDIKNLKDDQYLFLSESITQKKYKKPGKSNEKLLASHVSGIKNPMFTILGSELQSFTIYSDYISVIGKNYLSPIAKNSTDKYFFLMEDTLVNLNNDTSYTISYRPRKNKNFDGLKGIIQINTNGFAVENFSIEPVEVAGYSVTLRQKYEFIENTAWFPTQFDANLALAIENTSSLNASSNLKKGDSYLYGVSKTYIQNIILNPELKNKEFSHISFDYNSSGINSDSNLIRKYRIDSITAKEIKTYHLIDSISRAYKLESRLDYLMYLLKGEVPIGSFSMDLNEFLKFDKKQGLRLGIGLTTNDRISKNFKLGAYGAYGFRDYIWKYGSQFKLNLRDQFDSHIELKYKNDVSELSGYSFLETNGFLSPSTFRNYLIKSLLYEQSTEIAVEARFLYYLKTRVYGKFSKYKPNYQAYDISENNKFDTPIHIPEVGLMLRFAYHERYIRTPMGIQAIKTKYPVFFFNISKSLDINQFTIDYTRVWAKIEKDFTIRNLGISSISLQSGYAFGNLPYFKLFNGHGSYRKFTVLAPNSFGTMRLNEFIADRFTYLFLTHNFGKLLIRTNKIEPEISIVHNMGWSELNETEIPNGLSAKTMSKGYFESGLIIDNILKMNYLQYGFGVFYRYGSYAFEKQIDNFAFKLSLKYSI